MNEYYFHLDHLTVGYDKKPLIKDICIGIEKGEIVTLIGPNGSGKSTILKSITRQLKLVGGNVEFDGKNLHELSFRELSTKMAVVLTERMKPELMTCHDIVATGRYPYTGRLGMLTREDEEKVEKAMRAVHAEELGGRDFNAISDGQRQRVLLARAICQEPEVIILDEPTSFLDIRHKLELLAILRRMAKEKGITVIMSLHEIDLAQKISDKIICVKGDAISHFGAPETIFREDIIRELYEIDNGSFDPCFGSIELPRPEGTPRVFVLAGGGTGIPVFRKLDRQIKLLTSIKEIGITLATALIVATGGFSYFDNAKQISRFIGICPTYQQSGTSVHIKGGINRNGDVSLRSLLYAASWSALRGNTTCKECYTRLKANGNLPRWLLLLLQTSSSGKHLP